MIEAEEPKLRVLNNGWKILPSLTWLQVKQYFKEDPQNLVISLPVDESKVDGLDVTHRSLAEFVDYISIVGVTAPRAWESLQRKGLAGFDALEYNGRLLQSESLFRPCLDPNLYHNLPISPYSGNPVRPMVNVTDLGTGQKITLYGEDQWNIASGYYGSGRLSPQILAEMAGLIPLREEDPVVRWAALPWKEPQGVTLRTFDELKRLVNLYQTRLFRERAFPNIAILPKTIPSFDDHYSLRARIRGLYFEIPRSTRESLLAALPTLYPSNR